MKMKAAIYYGPGDLKIEEIERPKAQDGVDGRGMVVKIGACGICPIMDFPKYRQKVYDCANGISLGHEHCGEVIEVGPKLTEVKVGDKVYGLAYRPCFKCEACLAGDYGRCRRYPTGTAGSWINGAFAEYMLYPFVSNESIIKLPDSMSFQDGALLEPLILGIGLADKAKTGDVVVIFQQDFMGLATIVELKEKGLAKKVIVSDISKKRLEAAKNTGADIVVNELDEDIVKVVMKETSGAGAQVVIVASGRPPNFQQSIDVVQHKGNIWLGTFFDAPFMFNPSLQRPEMPRSNMTQKGFNIQCAWGTLGLKVPRLDEAIRLIQSGKIIANKFVTHVFPLDKIKEGFETAMNSPDAIKVLIAP
jgi:threonine dehydrogenase-like Zn-dependent dehydrogenase